MFKHRDFFFCFKKTSYLDQSSITNHQFYVLQMVAHIKYKYSCSSFNFYYSLIGFALFFSTWGYTNVFFMCQLTQPLSSSGQVVVPEELCFPHACCVGIASQTSLSLFNPSERWQQVSITVTGLAIDGEKVSWGSCAKQRNL